MPAVTKIKKIDGGFIVYTAAILKAAEEELLKAELKAISAEQLGYVFFRVR